MIDGKDIGAALALISIVIAIVAIAIAIGSLVVRL
jgi:hypothetical protein